MVLHPNLSFLPKVLSEFHLSQSVELWSFPSSGESQQVEQCQSAPSGPWQSTFSTLRPSERLINTFSALTPGFWADLCLSRGCSTGRWTPYSRHMCCQLCLSHPGCMVWLPHGPCGGGFPWYHVCNNNMVVPFHVFKTLLSKCSSWPFLWGAGAGCCSSIDNVPLHLCSGLAWHMAVLLPLRLAFASCVA